MLGLQTRYAIPSLHPPLTPGTITTMASSSVSRADFNAIHQELNETFAIGRTKSIEWRKWQLKQFWWMIEDNEQLMLDALKKDLGRHEMEARASDLLGLRTDILEHIKHVDEWAAEERVSNAGFLFGTLGKARIRKEPLGVVLVIGAWNFPFLLTLQPVIAAIAAGCCVVIKPSELASASEQAMADLVSRYLDPSAIRLVTGGPEETSLMLQLKFDHIFFTGSSKIARFITAAAAKHLTPTTLELGGQCPAIVGKTANVDLAAKRVAWAKFLNAGQICLSVNHVFVDSSIYEKFLQSLERWTKKFATSGHMCRIINERNYDRLAGIMEKTEGRIISVDKNSPKEKKLAGTIVADVSISGKLKPEQIRVKVCKLAKSP